VSRSNNRCGAGRPAPAGFTLLEVLVAFMVVALALGALLPALSQGMNGIQASQFYAAALAEARSKIEQVGAVIPLEDAELSGKTGTGLDWMMRIHREGSAARLSMADEGKAAVRLFDVEVRVSGGRGRTVALRTLRLGPRE
jgi:general secretion pathway protein I